MLYFILTLLLLGFAAAWAFNRNSRAFGRAVLSLARSLDPSPLAIVARKRRD
jgi:hypothetical protein